MNSATYKNLLRLLEKWPVDSTKSGRDFGEHIRVLISSSFAGVASKPTDKLETWDKIHAGLRRISSDQYKDAFQVGEVGGATGMTEEQCQQILSNHMLNELEEDSRSILDHIKSKFSKQS